MPPGCEGSLTLTVKVGVSPEPGVFEELMSLMYRYREALNHAIKVVIENRALSLGKAHSLLYSTLKERYGLSPKVAIDCYREAIAIAKSWLSNPSRGNIPRAKTLRLWLTHKQSYRLRDGYVEILGGFRLRVIGWDRRYDNYPSGDARLVFKDGKLVLELSKRVPKPAKYSPRGVLAVDVNERYVVVGNSCLELRVETPIERALHYRRLAEHLQRKYSSPKYSAWLRRRGIRRRVGYFYSKARRVVEDWAKKTSRKIVELARQHLYAVAREDLTGLVESLRKLPREHRVSLLILSYRRLEFWVDWQAEKNGAPLVVVEPRGTSSTCPRCNSKLVEGGYRRVRCPRCGLEADRDTVAVMNIEVRALSKMGGSLTTPTAPQMTDVSSNRCGEPMKPLKGTLTLQAGRRSAPFSIFQTFI
jgi:IS605 OrfB family transposase